MKTKQMYALGILVVVVTIGVGLWVILQPQQIEPIKKYVTTPLKKNNVTEIAETIEKTGPKKEATPEERALKGRETFLASMEFVGVDTENDSYWKLLQEAVNSPEYLEYQKKQDERIGTDLDLWWSFLESKGLSSGRMAQEERFREHFPTGDYVDYEPEMRKRLAELFLESGLSTTVTNDEKSVGETLAIMAQFRAEDEAYRVWMRGHFKGYVGDLDWAQEIRKSAVGIVTDMGNEGISVFTEDNTFAEPILTETAEENLDNEPEPMLFSDETPVLEDFGQVAQTIEEIEAELLKTFFPDVPKLPTEASIENAISEQFSLQRLSTAMQTLSQYGPKEGMRRLKESDPQVATHVERLIQKRQGD